MSYDILIFEPDSATDEDFPQWWKQVVSQWDEPHDFSTIEGSTPAIRSIYRDLIRTFPPFNGPDALVVTAGELGWRPTPTDTLVIPFSRATTETFPYCSAMVADGRSYRRRG